MKRVRSIAVALLLLAGSLALVELGVRIDQRVRLGMPMWRLGLAAEASQGPDPNAAVTTDGELGWRASSAFRFHGTVKDAAGAAREVTVTQGRHGYRVYGDVHARRPKILAIGDSYTQAVCVADGETYYERLGKLLGDVEIFGGGTTGWGTLQELLFLERTLDEIKPDVVLWQFSYNDYFDNDYALSRAWTAGCQASVRPFFEDGRIVYRYACHGPWATWTRLGYLLTTRLDRRRAAPPADDPLLQAILRLGPQHAGMRAALDRTAAIFARVRARLGDVPVVLFDVTTTAEPFFGATREIARRNGFAFVATLPAALDQARARGTVTQCEDRVHYASEGQRIIAEELARALTAAGLPKRGGSAPPPPEQPRQGERHQGERQALDAAAAQK
jgi:lysophospholipase L1-like esterase